MGIETSSSVKIVAEVEATTASLNRRIRVHNIRFENAYFSRPSTGEDSLRKLPSARAH